MFFEVEQSPEVMYSGKYGMYSLNAHERQNKTKKVRMDDGSSCHCKNKSNCLTLSASCAGDIIWSQNLCGGEAGSRAAKSSY